MLEQPIRPWIQRHILDKLIKVTKLNRFSPNAITVLGAILGLSIWPILAYQYTIAALLLLGLTGLCDMLDGSIARMTGNATPHGTVLDIVSDRLVEAAIMLGLLWADPTRGLWVAGMFAATLLCVTSFLVVGIFTENQSDKSFHYSPGLMERLEAFIFFALMIALPTYFKYWAALYILLVALTALIRVKEFYQQSILNTYGHE